MSDEALHLRKCKKHALRIFFTGEDVHIRYRKFESYCLNSVDLALGFDYEEDVLSDSYIRYPLWLCYFFGFSLNKDEIRKQVLLFNVGKPRFDTRACLVASHDDMGIRGKMVRLIRDGGIEVCCGGNFMHNDDSLKSKFSDDKIAYLSNFLFNICPENVSVKGYTTEKIFQAFRAGCIPVYYGTEGHPEPSVINSNSVIIYNGENDSDVVLKMKALINDEKFRTHFLSQNRLLVDEAVEYIYERNYLLRNKYEQILCAKEILK